MTNQNKQKHNFCVFLGYFFALCLPASTGLAQPLVIDDFSIDQATLFAIGAGATASSAVSGPSTAIVGGERDMEITVVAGAVVSGEVTGGAYNFSVAAATTGAGLLMWDGPDGLPDSADLDFTGLGGVDLTVGNTQNGILFRLVSADLPGNNVTFTVYTDAANFSSFTQPIPATMTPQDFVLPYGAFTVGGGAGADFSNVGAVTAFISGFELDARLSLVRTAQTLTATMVDALSVDTDGDGLFGPGDTIKYTVVLNNPDDAAGQDVTGVVFDLPNFDPNTTLVAGSVMTSQGTVTTGNTGGDTGVSVDVGTIPDAASVTLMFEVVIASPLAPTITQVSAQGTVTTDGGTLLTDDPDDATSDQDPTVTPVVTPNLSATKVDSLLIDSNMDGQANPGDTVRYTVALQNTGGAPATGVSYSVGAVANTALVVGSVTASQGTVSSGNGAGDTTITVDVGSIPAGGSVTITHDVVIDNPLPSGVTEISCQGTITATNATPTTTDDPDVGGVNDPTDTPVAAASDLSLSKDDGGGTVMPGATIVYTLGYANNGSQNATGVQLSETVPANTTFNAGASTAGWVCVPDASAGSSCTLAIGSLAAGANATAIFAIDVDDPLPAGVTQIANTATIADDGANGTDQNPADNTASDTTPTVVTTPTAPAISAIKTDALALDNDSNAQVNPGDTLEYTVVITNSGDAAGEGVSFALTTPDPNTTLVVGSVTTTQGTVTAGNNAGDTTVSVAIGTLAVDATVTLTFQATINDPLPEGVTQIVCQGTVSGTNFSDVLTDDAATTATSDATTTLIGPSSVAAIPTLSQWALLLLLASIGLLACQHLGSKNRCLCK